MIKVTRFASQEGERSMNLDEAGRQLELAIHDARVAFDCIALEDVDRAHTNAITARAALDAAETALRHAVREDADAAAEKEAGAP